MLFRPALISALALAAAPLFSAQAAILDLTDRSVFAGGPAAGSWINNIDGTGINVFIESAGGSMNTRE
ncbi:MAG: hypothetical protein HRU11_12600, partial [Parvularculaceae bacterium]|nr:hypothetical protein [Parvularculaceae bacterium]